MPKTVLLTGISGFAGHHAMEHILQNTNWNIVGLASFQHKGDSRRIADVDSFDPARVRYYYCDISAPLSPRLIKQIGPVDYIINMASESHVDRSIEYPKDFIENNVRLVLNMLEYARVAKPKVFIQISTDEVYGPAPGETNHKEWAAMLPSNPYAASKAAQEAIATSYWRTYGVPVVITNTMNLIGERQDPEKFVPLVIGKVLRGEQVIIHGTKDGKPGSRFYLHARNMADAILYIIQKLPPKLYGHTYEKLGPSSAIFGDFVIDEVSPDRPDRYNIVGEREVDNLEMAKMIAAIVGKPLKYKIVDFHSSRPGHDLRYGLNGTKLKRAGWTAPVPFPTSLDRLVRWTLDNPDWLE